VLCSKGQKVSDLLLISLVMIALVGSLDSSSQAESTAGIAAQAIENQVFVEGGSFKLGDVGHPNGSPYVVLTDHARPAVDVSVDSYSISKYETTWGEMRVYYEKVGHISLYEGSGYDEKFIAPPSEDPLSPYFHLKPARTPNYYEAEGYCAWLSDQTGLPFALPTEAQWEYAARSRGKEVPYATGTGEANPDTYLQRPVQYIDPSIPPSGNMLSHDFNVMERRPVGSYPPNSIGIHDMTGNVAEWTQDWFKPDFYTEASFDNPRGPKNPLDPAKPQKTVRDWAGMGGSFGGGDTVFARSGGSVDSGSIGFRCVVNHPEPIN